MEDKYNTPAQNQGPAWQRHLLLIVGVALPFALMAFVLIYQTVITASIALPKYAAVYAVINPDYSGRPYFELNVVNNRLVISYLPPKTDDEKKQIQYNQPKATIWVQKDYTKPATEYVVNVPTTLPDPETNIVSIPVPDGLAVDMITGPTAPDGYTYNMDYNSRSGGFFTEIFVGGGNYGPAYTVVNGPRIVPLMFSSSDGTRNYYYGNNPKFLGWIKEPLS